MIFIIAISVASLVSLAGVFLLMKVKKENLSWFYKLAAYKAIFAGAMLVAAALCIGVFKLAHCGEKDCDKNTCCQNSSSCVSSSSESCYKAGEKSTCCKMGSMESGCHKGVKKSACCKPGGMEMSCHKDGGKKHIMIKKEFVHDDNHEKEAEKTE